MEVASFLCVCLEGEETLKCCCVDQHPCFKTVSNNNDAQKCDFFVFDHNYSFGANLVQKLKMPVQAEIWYLGQSEYAEFSFFLRLEVFFLGKSGLKSQNCQLKLKFGTQSILNMHNSMVIFTFSVLDLLCKFCQNSPFRILMLSDSSPVSLLAVCFFVDNC